MTSRDTRALLAMAGDCTAAEWAVRVEATAPEVAAWCRARGLRLRDEPTREEVLWHALADAHEWLDGLARCGAGREKKFDRRVDTA